MKKALISLAFLTIAGLSLPTNATVIFDNGDPNQVSGQVAYQNVITWEDFAFNQDEILTDMHFYTIENQKTGFWDGTLLYIISPDVGGQPGPLASWIAAGPAANVSKTDTGVDAVGGAYDEYLYEFDLASLALDANTKYWVGIFMGANSSNIFWETTGSGYGSTALSNVGGGGYSNFNKNLAFRLTGVPLPPTALLVLLGIAGLAATRQGRSKGSSLVAAR